MTAGPPLSRQRRYQLRHRALGLCSLCSREVFASSGGSGKVKRTFTERHLATRKGARAMGYKTTGYYQDALKAQGLPDDFLAEAPFTVAGKIKCVGNGVPMALGRAIAQAVRQAVAR